MSDHSAVKGFAGLSLARQFAFAGGIVIMAAAIAVGGVVAGRIEQVVVRNTANATALYMESFVGPLTRELTQQETLNSRSSKGIGELLAQSQVGVQVLSFKVWRPGGLVIDASNKALIGKTFAVTDSLRMAFAGEVQGEFEDHGDEEDSAENALGVPLLEIYTPIRNPQTGAVIAVVEFYEVAEKLKQDIRSARAQTWAWVVGLLSLIGAALFLIVLRGSRTIDAQIEALKDMSARNLALRLQIQSASARSAAMGERTLRQIGADLHDGPAQLMAFAALRLDALKGKAGASKDEADLTEISAAVTEAITEIRNLSRGLSVPDLDKRDMREVLQGLAGAHAARTATEVAIDIAAGELPEMSAALRVCIYRFVQEGLNNSWRHAGGRGQELRISHGAGVLIVSVLDRGPGFPSDGPPAAEDRTQRLGLVGLKDRVEALGGRLDFFNRIPKSPGARAGAELRMTIEVKP